MYDLTNLDYDQIDSILDRLWDEDGLVLEFNNFTQEQEEFILHRGFTIWLDNGVLFAENDSSDDLNSAWID